MTVALQVPPSPLPPVEQLLVAGGDARIALDARGLNKYGCTPLPDPGLIALGSSTATGISTAGLLAATRLRDQLVGDASHAALSREAVRIKQELAQLCEVAALPGLEIMLAASGTDAHALAVRISRTAANRSMRVIMVDAAESGSGVPSALAEAGTPTGPIEVVTVPIRLSDGAARPLAEVDAEFAALTNEAAATGQRVLLVLTDVSKTGLLAPSPACVMALKERLPDTVDVLVDACQFRITPATLRAYLMQGCMVAITGSKFMTGPSFSGALLIPAVLAQRLRAGAFLNEVGSAGYDNFANLGLLLRWEAALADMRAFRALAEAEVASFLEEFARAVRKHLLNNPVFDLLPAPELGRHPLHEEMGWDCIQTIFSFSLRDPKSRTPLSREQTMQVYQLLQLDLSEQREFNLGTLAVLRCQLGQPVECGVRDGIPVSALRICASARMVVEAASCGSDSILQRTLAALDKTAQLVAAVQNDDSRYYLGNPLARSDK